MTALLSLSRWIDRLSEFVGRWVAWLVLAAVLISAINATVRKLFNVSSNAYLEIQWYLYAGVFLLTAGYTMLRNEHVKIDVLTGHLSRRRQIWIDVFGICAFLLPFVFVVVELSIPLVLRAWESGEVSSNAGGLIRWPVYVLVPIGFVLLGVQAVSELIKRIAFLRGLIPDPTSKPQGKTAEEELAEFLKQEEVAARDAGLAGDRK